MQGLKTVAPVFNRHRIFDVGLRSAITGRGHARSDFREQDSRDFLNEGRLSLLPGLRIFYMRSAIAERGRLVRISSNKIHLTFVTRGYNEARLSLLPWHTAKARVLADGETFSVGIVLTTVPSPNSRRWLLRPYRK